MNIEVRKNEELSRYEAIIDGQVAGFAQYRLTGGAVSFPHTEVASQYEGQGVGGRIAQFALDDVRAIGEKAVPLCPFISGYIHKHPEYADLVHPTRRGTYQG